MATRNADKNALIAKLQDDVKKAVEAKYAHAEKLASMQGKKTLATDSSGFYVKVPYAKAPYVKVPYIKLA